MYTFDRASTFFFGFFLQMFESDGRHCRGQSEFSYVLTFQSPNIFPLPPEHFKDRDDFWIPNLKVSLFISFGKLADLYLKGTKLCTLT